MLLIAILVGMIFWHFAGRALVARIIEMIKKNLEDDSSVLHAAMHGRS